MTLLDALRVLTAAVRSWGRENVVYAIDVAAALVGAGASTHVDLAPEDPVLGAATDFACVERRGDHSGALAVLDRVEPTVASEVLQVADGFVHPDLAPAIADRLEAMELFPAFGRLPALLAVRDSARCDRLVARLAEAAGVASEVWTEAVVEARLAAGDGDVEVPTGVRAAWRELEAMGPTEVDAASWYEARLRAAARAEPGAAAALMRESVDAVGSVAVGEGVIAVMARVAAVDRDAAWRIFGALSSPVDRAIALQGLCFEGDFGGREERAILSVVDDDGGWHVGMALLGATAAADRGDLAAATAARCRLPGWSAFVATWPDARRRALRAGHDASAFWAAVSAAVATAPAASAIPGLPRPDLADMPPAVLDALWLVKASAISEMPWWTPWGSAIP